MESRTDQEQDKLINAKVSKQTLGIVTSVLIAAVGWALFAIVSVGGKVEAVDSRVSAVEGDIKAINVSIANIAKSLERLQK